MNGAKPRGKVFLPQFRKRGGRTRFFGRFIKPALVLQKRKIFSQLGDVFFDFFPLAIKESFALRNRFIALPYEHRKIPYLFYRQSRSF